MNKTQGLCPRQVQYYKPHFLLLNSKLLIIIYNNRKARDDGLQARFDWLAFFAHLKGPQFLHNYCLSHLNHWFDFEMKLFKFFLVNWCWIFTVFFIIIINCVVVDTCSRIFLYRIICTIYSTKICINILNIQFECPLYKYILFSISLVIQSEACNCLKVFLASE